MKWYIHVNQHKIRENIHAKNPEPPSDLTPDQIRKMYEYVFGLGEE